MLADAYREAMGSDAILVKGGEITMPETQSVDHIFTHNVQWINQNPSYDLTISGWQSGVGDGMYSSSEDMPKVLKGIGTAIVSTSRGVMTDKRARKENVGGEVLAFIW